jgi:hypothetical protein
LFFPPPQSFEPASTHREEEEVVQPVFGVERNLPCTDQIPKANTHNKQSLQSAKKLLVLDLSSLKNLYEKKTLSEADHVEKETTTTDQSTNTQRQRQRDRETEGESNL